MIEHTVRLRTNVSPTIAMRDFFAKHPSWNPESRRAKIRGNDQFTLYLQKKKKFRLLAPNSPIRILVAEDGKVCRSVYDFFLLSGVLPSDACMMSTKGVGGSDQFAVYIAIKLEGEVPQGTRPVFLPSSHRLNSSVRAIADAYYKSEL